MSQLPDPEHLDQAIRRHRTAVATVTLQGPGGPLAGQEVWLAQTRHRFLFGGTWGEGTLALVNDELDGAARRPVEQRNRHYLNLFNLVTLPFYWGRFEPQRGRPQTERLRRAAQWYRDQGCRVKGHPLCWHTLAPDWLLGMSNAEILAAQQARIRREVAGFAGLIDLWDGINEAVIMPIFDRYDNGLTRLGNQLGRIQLIRTVFETARQANPACALLINDFDVSPAYDILVEGCLAAGIRIDAIGIQTHMHQGYWGPARTLAVIERFARFNLPVHFTESSLVSGHRMPPEIVDLNDYQVDEWPSTPAGEVRQAQEVVLHYKTLLAHPAVQAVTWWDFTDGGWLNAPSGLLRADGTPKPAYLALEQLIKGEWWLPPTRWVTDAAGRFTFSGFLGDYELAWGGQKMALALEQAGPVAVNLAV
ncbi:MAG: endo-1,4-beta-xylanase [Anaerolineaceae bacterium]|nr:endo-1,4-beta-xylanase [Anaerolineaceae bacterium]